MTTWRHKLRGKWVTVWQAGDRSWTLASGVEIKIYRRVSQSTYQWAGRFVIPPKLCPYGEGHDREFYSKNRLDLPRVLRVEIAKYLNPRLRETIEKMENQPKTWKPQ